MGWSGIEWSRLGPTLVEAAMAPGQEGMRPMMMMEGVSLWDTRSQLCMYLYNSLGWIGESIPRHNGTTGWVNKVDW